LLHRELTQFAVVSSKAVRTYTSVAAKSPIQTGAAVHAGLSFGAIAGAFLRHERSGDGKSLTELDLVFAVTERDGLFDAHTGVLHVTTRNEKK
jgi:hypothetical protein